MGYNGFPSGCSDDEYPWAREGDELSVKYTYVTHAELNAILNFRGGNTSLLGATLYVTLFPCNECAKAIIQTGIRHIVYESDKYAVTAYKKEGVTSDKNSDAVVSNYKAVTDKITVKDNGISDIDIGLYQAGIFDLDLDVNINQVTVQNPDETKVLEMENPKLAKYDVKPQYTNNTTVYVEYTIEVSNKGEISGYAKKIVDYIPQGMTFNSTINEAWYTGTDGNLYTSALADIELKPGETKEIKLVLTKQMTEENTGLVNNLAEIAEDYNIYGVSDTNSTPFNKAQGENDLGSADAILTVKTGEVFIYISVIITSIMLGATVIFIAYTQIVVKRRKAGV